MFVPISEEVEEKFRAKVYERFGMKKGNIKKALEEAILQWVKQ